MVSLDEAQEAIQLYEQSPEDFNLLQSACIESTRYLMHLIDNMGEEPHWFCEESGPLGSLGAKSILAMSFDGAREKYCEYLGPILTRCANCARLFYIELSRLLDDLKVAQCPSDMCDQFYINVIDRSKGRLEQKMSEASELFRNNPGAGLVEAHAYIVPLYECLCCNVLKDKDALFDDFKFVLLKLCANVDQPVLTLSEILPGVLLLFFGDDGPLHRWSKQVLKDITTTEINKTSKDAFTRMVKDAKARVQYQDARVFWFNMWSLIERLGRSDVVELCALEPSVSQFLTDELLLLPSTSIHSVLGTFRTMLERIGSEYWKHTSAMPRSLVAATVENQYLFEKISNQGPVDLDYDSDYLLHPKDLVDWALPLLKTCQASALFSVGEQVSRALLKLSTRVPQEKSDVVRKAGLETLYISFDFTMQKTALPLVSPNDRVLRGDLKQMLSSMASVILDGLKSGTFEEALEVVVLAVQFDVASGMPDQVLRGSSSAVSDAVQAEIAREYPAGVWDGLNKRPTLFKKELAQAVLKACKYSVFIPHAPTKKHDDQYWPKGQLSKNAVKMTVQSLTNISDCEPRDLKVILQGRETLTSVLLNMFSCEWDQNQAAVDILCQAYETDTVNRFDGVLAMLQSNLRGSLDAMCDAMELVHKFQMFSPCSQLTKVLQDVTSCLFGAAGVLDNSKDQFSYGTENELVRFWNVSWSLIKMTFECTFHVWGKVYKADTMLEFMRDQLDYCKTLLDAFRLVETTLSKSDANTKFGEILVKPAINSVESLCILLRLKDESLLHMSHENIMSVIELVRSYKIEFPSGFIKLLEKIASRELSNVLPREKTVSLLAATDQFSNEQIDDIVKKAHSSPAPSTSPAPPESSTTPAPRPASTSTLASTATAKAKPKTLTDFMRMMPGPAPQPSKTTQPSKSGRMDEIRDAVRQERNASTEAGRKKEIKEVHPARPAGFHSKRAQEIAARKAAKGNQQQQNEEKDGSSSSSEDNDDSELESLFTSKPKPVARPTGSGPASRVPTTVIPGAGNRRPAVQSQKEREEHFMRLRLNIDLNPLYRQVLSWDYHRNSEYPEDKVSYTKVKPAFESAKEYQATFEPLLLLECWQSIVRSKEELNGAETPFKIVVGNRVTCDDFIDVYAMVAASAVSDLRLGDSDLVVLTYYETQSVKAQRPDALKPYCLAKIKEIKNASRDVVDVILRTYRPGALLPYLGSKYELHASRVISMTTIEREYCSLKALPYYDLNQPIWKGEPASLQQVASEKVSEVKGVFKVNDSQAKAIVSSISTPGFSLIQGPPGTGKTKTILGIVGAYITGSAASAPSIINSIGVRPQDLKKVLICAPSNAAVDELVLRLKGGIVGYNGQNFEPRVVRLGRSEAINPQVKELTLEDQVEQAVSNLEQKNFDSGSDGSIRQQINDAVKRRNDLRAKLNSDQQLEAIEYENIDMEVRQLNQKIKQMGHQMDLQREQSQVAARKRDIERRRIQNEVLQKSQIICATLSGSAHNVLSSLQMDFDTVIIDEAAQCIELSALIPLKYGCKQCIMVGDPNQLPPTVLSQAAASYNYEQSLFVRMFNRYPENVHMLDMQFRMHPAIARFPSAEFYKGKLLNGPEMAITTARPWHSKSLFSPYRFFDVKAGKQVRSSSRSLFNPEEAQVALELFTGLVTEFNVDSGNIGIISPYKRQVQELKRTFSRAYGNEIFNEVDFNTIDGFQGQEKDVIILSCVRAERDSKGVGFLSDTRRMNVAITRARSSMWILGNEDNLVANPVWRHLIGDAKERGMFTHASRGFLTRPQSYPPVQVPVAAQAPEAAPSQFSDVPNTTAAAAAAAAAAPGAAPPAKEPSKKQPKKNNKNKNNHKGKGKGQNPQASGKRKADNDNDENRPAKMPHTGQPPHNPNGIPPRPASASLGARLGGAPSSSSSPTPPWQRPREKNNNNSNNNKNNNNTPQPQGAPQPWPSSSGYMQAWPPAPGMGGLPQPTNSGSFAGLPPRPNSSGELRGGNAASSGLAKPQPPPKRKKHNNNVFIPKKR